MSMTAPALQQAREFLMDGAAQRITLLRHIKEQGRKITELEREVQKQMTLRDQAEQALSDARKEIESLRAQMPDDATINAYHSLVEYLTQPSELNPQLRVAA
jgi:chromosome segregation ATPase